MTSRWELETTFKDDAENVCIIAAALDPGFRNLMFLPAEESLKVQVKVQALAPQEKRRETEETQQHRSVEQNDSVSARHFAWLR